MSNDNDEEHEFYVTTYCNFAHRLSDGQALGEEGDDEWHECDALSPTKLRIERDFGANAVEGSMTEFYPGEMEALENDETETLERIYWRHAPSLTLDDAIEQLTKLRKESPLGGQTVVHVCLLNSEIEYLQPKRIRLETDPSGGAMIVLDDGDHGLGLQAPDEDDDDED